MNMDSVNINDAELPDLLLAELYGNNLVAGSMPPPVPVPPPAAAGTYKFLGSNQQKIGILVQSPGAAFLPDEQLNVLTKMLEACKLNMGDVALVNHAVTAVNIDLLK